MKGFLKAIVVYVILGVSLPTFAYSPGNPSVLVSAGVVAPAVVVPGMFYYGVQTTSVGGDVYGIEVSLDGTNWTALSSISADGSVQFSGVYHSVRIVKTSGVGTTARVIFNALGLP